MRYELYLFINGCASAIIAILLWHCLPKKFQQPKWSIILWFFSISMCMPIAGILFVIIATILSYWFERKTPEKVIQAVFAPVFMREKISTPTAFGESGAWVRLHSGSVTSIDKMQAMFAANAAQVTRMNNLNLDMLRADDDQLRLYAFGLINKQSKKIDQQISKLKQQLDENHAAIDRAKVNKSLAFLYWEMVFAKLVQDDLLIYSLNKAIQYSFASLKQIPDDMGLWVLLGRIYFYQKEYSKAKEAFEKAEKLRAPYEKILPYLAELSFMERDFVKVRKYLSLCDTLMYVPKLHDVVKFWRAS